MTRCATRVLTVTGLLAATCAVVPAASAQTDAPETATTRADVDGDGRTDGVMVREVAADRLALIFGLAGESVDVTTEWDASLPLPNLRPVDVNGDGRDEVVVAETVGANTTTFNLWRYDDIRGIVPVHSADGARLRLFEGGGASAISGYGCLDRSDTAARDLTTVNARATETRNDPTFDGARTSYRVENGFAIQVDRTDFTRVPRNDPMLATDPHTCAPR